MEISHVVTVTAEPEALTASPRDCAAAVNEAGSPSGKWVGEAGKVKMDLEGGANGSETGAIYRTADRQH